MIYVTFGSTLYVARCTCASPLLVARAKLEYSKYFWLVILFLAKNTPPLEKLFLIKLIESLIQSKRGFHQEQRVFSQGSNTLHVLQTKFFFLCQTFLTEQMQARFASPIKKVFHFSSCSLFFHIRASWSLYLEVSHSFVLRHFTNVVNKSLTERLTRNLHQAFISSSLEASLWCICWLKCNYFFVVSKSHHTWLYYWAMQPVRALEETGSL